MKLAVLLTFALFLQALAVPTGDLVERVADTRCELNVLHCGSVMQTYSTTRVGSLETFQCGGITNRCNIDRSLYKCGHNYETEFQRECKNACVPTPPGQNDYCASSLYEGDGRPDQILDICVRRVYDDAARTAENAKTPLEQKGLEVRIDGGLYRCVFVRNLDILKLPGQDPNHQKELKEVEKELKAKYDKSKEEYDEMKRQEDGGKA